MENNMPTMLVATELEPRISVTVKEYTQLLRSEAVLDALEAGGVDNWEGYDIAMQSLQEDETGDFDDAD